MNIRPTRVVLHIQTGGKLYLYGESIAAELSRISSKVVTEEEIIAEVVKGVREIYTELDSPMGDDDLPTNDTLLETH